MQSVLKWKVWKEMKTGEKKKAKEHLLSPKTRSPANTFASPPSAMLPSRITTLKEDKSNPAPSADSKPNKKIYSSATRVILFLLSLLLEKLDSRPLWKKAQLCESPQPSQGAWAKSRGQLETAAVRSTPTGREEEKRGWIHRLLYMIPFWPQKSWFLFSLSNKKFLLPSYSRVFS